MTDMGSVFLDRDNPKEGLKSIMQGTDYMKQGLSMGLFPEGTRNHSDQLLPFKEGGYRMAEKSKSPIVVMALTGFDRIFEANKFHLIWKRKVIIEFDKPVYPSELSTPERKAFYASIPGRIEAMMAEHKL
jgi:1-acyl-sn-glycerol-3-phosphate acyltransferase